MENHNTRYPWIRRQPEVRIEDLVTQVATGDNSTAIRRLIKKWLRAVLRRAVDPIRVESTPVGRRATCMGVMRITTGPDHDRWLLIEGRAWIWDEEQRRYKWQWSSHCYVLESQCMAFDPPAFRVRILQFLVGLGWQRLVNSGAAFKRADHWSWPQWIAHPAFTWIHGLIDERRLQEMLAEALGVDRTLSDIIQRADPYPRGFGVDCWDAGLVATHRNWFLRLNADAPGLLQMGFVLQWRRVGLDPGMEPVAAIKKFLRERGLTKKAWKLLSRVPDAPVRLQRLSSEPGALIVYLNWHVRAGLDTLAHADFLYHVAIFMPEEWMSPVEGTRLREPLFRILVREAVAAEANGTLQQWLEEACLRPRYWPWSDQPDPNQVRAGWRWLRRRIAAEELKQRHMAAVESERCLEPKSYALREFGHGGLVAYALETVCELQEEGRAMDHCLRHKGSARHRFAAKGVRFFSVRGSECGERVATLKIKRDDDAGQWVVGECEGPFDEGVSAETLVFARQLANAYAAADDAVDRTIPGI